MEAANRSDTSGKESETQLRLWRKQEELKNRRGDEECQFYQEEVKMIDGMAEARKLIKHMQSYSSKIQGIVEEADPRNQTPLVPKPPVIIFAADVQDKLMEIKELVEEDDSK